MLSLETCLKLKDAGWPQNNAEFYYDGANRRKHFYGEFERVAACPTLEELLAAIVAMDGVYEVSIHKASGQSWAMVTNMDGSVFGTGHDWTLPEDPSEAAAALLLKLKGMTNE